MAKHPSRKVMNFRHLLGCDTIADTLKISSQRVHGELAVKETLMRNFNQIWYLIMRERRHTRVSELTYIQSNFYEQCGAFFFLRDHCKRDQGLNFIRNTSSRHIRVTELKVEQLTLLGMAFSHKIYVHLMREK